MNERTTPRQLRVGEEIRRRLAEIFRRTSFREPELATASITVTEVTVSADLRHAKVYVTRLGRNDIAALLPALARATSFLQREVGRDLRLRFVPTLVFLADTAFDQAGRIEAVLHSPAVRRDLVPR